MSTTKRLQASDQTPFGRFENLSRRLFSVPKHELDAELAKDKPEDGRQKPKTKKPEEKPEA